MDLEPFIKHGNTCEQVLMESRDCISNTFTKEVFASLCLNRKEKVLMDFIGECSAQERLTLLKCIENELYVDFLGLLPLEISLQILSYSTANDLFSCYYVSRRWREVVSQASPSWHLAAREIGLSPYIIDSKMRGHQAICSVVLAAMKHKRCLSSLKTGVVDVLVGGDIDTETYLHGGNGLIVCMKDRQDCEQDGEKVGYMEVRRIGENGSLLKVCRVGEVDVSILPRYNSSLYTLQERYVMWLNCFGDDEDSFHRIDYSLFPATQVESIEYDMPTYVQQVLTNFSACKRCGLIVISPMDIDRGRRIEFSIISYANRRRAEVTTCELHLSTDLASILMSRDYLDMRDAHLIPSKEDTQESPQVEGLDTGHCKHHYLFFTSVQTCEISMYRIPTEIVGGTQLPVTKVYDLPDVSSGNELNYMQYTGLHFVNNFTLMGRVNTKSGQLEVWEVNSGELHCYTIPEAMEIVEFGQVYSIISCHDAVKVIMTYTGEIVLTCAFGMRRPLGFFGTAVVEWLNVFEFYGSTQTHPNCCSRVDRMGHKIWQIVSFTTSRGHFETGIDAKALVAYFD